MADFFDGKVDAEKNRKPAYMVVSRRIMTLKQMIDVESADDYFCAFNDVETGSESANHIVAFLNCYAS